MTINTNSKLINSVRLFRTSPHPCSYKENQRAATVFVDPDLVIEKSLNSKLSDLGYRRSGAHLYRPDCDFCNACISCRIPIDQFAFNQAQRKIWRKNQDLKVIERNDLICEESFALYESYINTRHADGDMYPATPEQFEAFIKSKTVDTRFFLFFQEDRLISVSVTDILERGVSAVYTFFDPMESKRSLGIHSILHQIYFAKVLKLPYVFLGYWIKNCKKMEYKSKFRPLEMLIDGNWILVK